MLHPGQPIDPTSHVSYVRLAWTLVQRIHAALRPDEINPRLRGGRLAAQFYDDIRAHFQQERRERPPSPPAQHPEDCP